MQSIWFKHISDPDKKTDFEKLLRNSTLSLGRLREIIRELKEALHKTERSSSVYESPSWAFQQAHINGMLQAYSNIDQLLSFIDEETKNDRPRTKR